MWLVCMGLLCMQTISDAAHFSKSRAPSVN
jgi:hypothetical protein